MFDASLAGLAQVFTLQTFSLMLIGTAAGFVVGMLPGIGGLATLALMLPFTFDMKPVEAFAFLLGMLATTGTTGDITSILFGKVLPSTSGCQIQSAMRTPSGMTTCTSVVFFTLYSG